VAVIDFLQELTDERVVFERALLAHPEIFVSLDGTAPDNRVVIGEAGCRAHRQRGVTQARPEPHPGHVHGRALGFATSLYPGAGTRQATHGGGQGSAYRGENADSRRHQPGMDPLGSRHGVGFTRERRRVQHHGEARRGESP
jgi:hypothetical protein